MWWFEHKIEYIAMLSLEPEGTIRTGHFGIKFPVPIALPKSRASIILWYGLLNSRPLGLEEGLHHIYQI